MNKTRILYYIPALIGCLCFACGEPTTTNSKNESQLEVALRFVDEGHAFYDDDEWSDALRSYDLADSVFHSANLQNTIYYVDLLLDQGDLLEGLEQGSLALKNFQSARDLAQELDEPKEFERALVRIGAQHMTRKAYPKARAAFRRYNSTLDETDKYECNSKAYWTLMIADSYNRQDSTELAVQYYKRALELAEKAENIGYKIQCRLELIRLTLNERDHEEARSDLQHIYQQADSLGAENVKWQTLFEIARTFKAEGRLDSAIAHLKDAAAIIEVIRKEFAVDHLRIGYFNQADGVYRELVELYYLEYGKHNTSADLDSLFKYLQFTRGREIVRNRVIENEPFLQAKRKLERLQHVARSIGEITDSHTAQIAAAKRDLIGRFVHLQQEGGYEQEELVTLEQAKNYTKAANIGLLFYHIYGEKSFVLSINGENVKTIPLDVRPAEVAANVNALMRPFYSVETTQDAKKVVFRPKKAHQLYQNIVAPVTAELNLSKKLLIVGDTPIIDLNFDMLMSDSTDSPAYSPSDNPEPYIHKLLVNDYAFAYAQNLSFMNHPIEARSSSSNILVAANPFEAEDNSEALRRQNLRKITGYVFSPLLNAEKEGELLKKIIESVKLLKRGQASEAAVLSEIEEYDMLHFATHAWYDSLYDAFSGIVLGFDSTQANDGLLMGYEIAQLRLNCDLVSLSACETGRGKVESAEGIMGLPRLFMNAGAKSVVMTMWKLYDASGPAITPAFYDAVVHENFSKIEALALAKRAFIKDKLENDPKSAHPFFWAAFSLYGEPGKAASTGSSTNVIPVAFMIAISALLLAFLLRKFRRRT